MSEYYGAPNDFRNYLEHRMDDYRWSPNQHKGHKGNESSGSSNRGEKETDSDQKQLREDFRSIAGKYTTALERTKDSTLRSRLEAKRNIYNACLSALRRSNGGRLSESEVNYIRQFINQVKDILSAPGSTSLPGRRR